MEVQHQWQENIKNNNRGTEAILMNCGKLKDLDNPFMDESYTTMQHLYLSITEQLPLKKNSLVKNILESSFA